MPADVTEAAFEAGIEAWLLSADGGYESLPSAEYDAERALFPGVVTGFLKETQPAKWAKVEALHADRTDDVVLDHLEKALASRGALDVLRHGFKAYGQTFALCFFRPSTSLNPEAAADYAANRLTLTRQLYYGAGHTKSLDMVIAVNGLPVAKLELKNHLTGQNVKHAVAQYKSDRDPRDSLFKFKQRTLVHFAVDPDLVFMTTQLRGEETFFLPFNRGEDGGAGNPPNPGGVKTAYLWEEVLRRDSLLDLLQRFLHLEVTEKRVTVKGAAKVVRRETMIFPRYHQLDAVRRMAGDAREQGPGQHYLVQHSAGSGKSNSISWLAHRLASLHDAENRKVFSSVVVITDRVVLDQQLQETVYQFEHRRGVVQKIDKDTAQLTQALRTGVPIVITTLQKFPYVSEQLEKLGGGTVGEGQGRTYAVIVDEAHSSQSGETATDLKAVLAADEIRAEASKRAASNGHANGQLGAAGLDTDEQILREMLKRGRQANISFFAFTATPKAKTLEVFGTRGADGQPYPFHLYSMRQAIEEGFILDVLRNYTTYKAYFGLIKKAEGEIDVEKSKAAKSLARFLSLHPTNVAQKVEVIVEHFRRHTRHKIGGRAKAMVVTASRLHAVRYQQAFERYIAEKGYGQEVMTLVAFSGTVEDPDVPETSYTEASMNNGIDGKKIPEAFAGTEEPCYRVLIAADKFQTGFDQPLLHTMYVDKRLAGIQAVQTLSRLNRTCEGKDDTFVLDFLDQREEVFAAFQTFYESTTVSESAEPHQLDALQAKIMATGVIHQEDVEAFAAAYYTPRVKPTKKEHGKVEASLAPAKARFLALRDELQGQVSDDEARQAKEDAQDGFRSLLQSFTRLYAFLSQVMPYEDADLEKLYAYGRFLLQKIAAGSSEPVRLDDDVALKYYRLQKISEASIVLQGGQSGEMKGPTAVGTGRHEEEQIELSQLIDLLNDKFGTEFAPGDQLFFDAVEEDAVKDEEVRQAAEANSCDNFGYVFDRKLESLFIDRMEQNADIFDRLMTDTELNRVVTDWMRQRAYDRVRN